MKKNLHPDNYRSVVFQDLNNGTTFVTKSTAQSDETTTIDGKEYPLIKVYISSTSHPFFTGQEKLVDIEGRVDKFRARMAAAEKARESSRDKHTKNKKTAPKTNAKIKLNDKEKLAEQ